MNNYVLPHCLLPGQFGATVIEVANATQTPIELVTAVALAAASVAGQHVCSVQRKPGLVGPISLSISYRLLNPASERVQRIT